MSLLRKLFGSRNDRLIRKLRKVAEQINQFEPALQALSDAQLQQKTAEFRQRYQNGATLEQLLPEAFAVVREASCRVFNMRHFDVQLIGGLILNQGKIAEMRTGEGKTLMATLPAYLNALTGRGVHIVTVNDYLAKRDANWMRPLYDFLGMTTGVVTHEFGLNEKKQAYACDIVYATNNELGFDYLRDNMAYHIEDKMQRDLSFAIVDEVDSILIDEARTPLIISGPTEESSQLYLQINPLIAKLRKREKEDGPGDYYLDEKAKQAFLTEEGHQHVEELLINIGLLTEGDSLYAPSNIILMHHVSAALRAHTLYHRNVDYLVRDNQVMIVDEHTGRALPGRRWSEGLHQAVEAKENVTIENENQTLASITFQNYFRLYEKLAGMTGTADTEAYEFQQIYGLEVVVVPTNQPMVRKDYPDLVYLRAQDKFQAVIDDIKESLARQQPVLLGTASIETSEYLSKLMVDAGIQHKVLNAKFHDKEAEIIAQAGRPGAVTIATNMAGRGTDIVLGGNLEAELAQLPADATDEMKQQIKADWKIRHDQVLAAGGLYIIGSERHESRRIDNQLRGRSGRQGDAGSSRFYLSLEDNLIRIFASDRMAILMQRFGMQEGVALESSMLSRAIEGAQSKVEGRNFEIRKQLLEYDDVANQQRKVIYGQRNALLSTSDISATITEIRQNVLTELFHQFVPHESLDAQWNLSDLTEQLRKDFSLDLPLQAWIDADHLLDEEKLLRRIIREAENSYAEKEARAGGVLFRQFEKSVMLQCLDSQWKEHLAAMDYLRQGIHLRGYAQKNPKQEYKRESFELFTHLLTRIQYETTAILCRAEVPSQEEQPQLPVSDSPNASVVPFQQMGRNDPCYCGSGKKYKQCHGKL